MMQANSTVEVTIPAPQVEIQILQSPYDKPIKAIGFIDTGATKTMLNPEVLPDDAWRTHYEYFQAADGQKFSTSLITKKPIGIRFFPECIIWLHVIGNAPAPYADISNKLKQCCADSHADFKHPHPLWKNPEFFIQLPFKLNEDANPIKASHPGMTPDDLVLAREECNQLLALGLIEPTKSNWACPAFYVNKRTEQIRGKKRLVIDYKALNHFLLDDKFPLPKTKIQNCILPTQRPVPMTVMPFGLKVAPSLFQKAMIKIFEPILHTTLIYIDDILLYTQDQPTHAKLLQQFYDIVQAHGVMLSDKKSFIGQPNIDFLGMKFIDGRYQPGPHITQELLKFPEENLTTKEIQQFLGIVNYIKDFIPECSRYTSQLSKLLKKEPPPWGQVQTMALQKLKQVCQQPLPLKIPGTGHRILQTDASNEFWGAILIEEENGRKHFCGHASGQFKDSEKHYHAVYKEILAIKYGIKKFEFHLIGHHFTIMMDNTSFPRIMDLKNKGVPEPQLLRLKDWFSKYQFTVKHIKGRC
ncbi:UNVERIFIED_CONTAM: polyprotein [Sesamum radiatum]|uniref:Polyprotein n=1 Tax=Sesamum radiatum TaxID=300843 RepID=A0AAW2IN57_SESRA